MFPRPQSNGFADRINAIKGMINGNPQAMAMQLMQSNPQFAAFVRQNQGKSVEQIAQENGIDMEALRQALK